MNRLGFETSPYLLQHANNPVHWYAWGQLAIEEAKKQQKPILLSIGYSTCHWCHVMERESFEIREVADVMNTHFINIKLDREEHPEIDAIYMKACQLMTGQGGWPLNVFLTPELKPFYAGTYFPPEPLYGRKSWMEILHLIQYNYSINRAGVHEQAEKIMQSLQRSDEHEPLHNNLIVDEVHGSEWEEKLLTDIALHADKDFGGFGIAPKFPNIMTLQCMLYMATHIKHQWALKHLSLSIRKLLNGGIYDQIGGGLARYSVTRDWLVPHFEKMLYDNALLISLLSEVHLAKVDLHVSEYIQQCLAWVQREMLAPSGGFYCALDADSDGEEGKYYTWSHNEIKQILELDFMLFSFIYDVPVEGNWEGKVILQKIRTEEEAAGEFERSISDVRQIMSKAKRLLIQQRQKRTYPHRDDKIILNWNALMCIAYIRAYRALNNPDYYEIAVNNITFIRQNFYSSNGVLRHSLSNWDADANLDDYAFYIAALIDLFQLKGEMEYLKEVHTLMLYVLGNFYDSSKNEFYFTQLNKPHVIIRRSDLLDNTLPSANSVMTDNLFRAGTLFHNDHWLQLYRQCLERMRYEIISEPLSHANWGTLLSYETNGRPEIAVVGENYKEILANIAQQYLPGAVIAGGKDNKDCPMLDQKDTLGEGAIYLCINQSCLPPVKSVQELMQAISK